MKLFLSGKDMKKINIMRGNFSTGSIEIKNFTDNDFTNANLTFEIFERDIGFKVNYENGVPIVHINLGLTLRLSEVEDEKGPIKENIEFFVVSEDALKAVEKKAKTVMAEGLEIMRENQLDVADFYTILSNAGRAKFLKFLDGLEDKEDYLNHIVFKAAVDVSTK
ncbi:MAG: hypothetical protein J6K39_02625 [Clostridia bacterium]|nr:hypothetical protein [Clostridia bacterium]